jgi:hypothetical protein
LVATIDVATLKRDKPSSLEIEIRRGLAQDTHYTRIEIEGLAEYNRVFVGRTIGKIKSEIASMYRRDLCSGEIVIRFNSEELAWQDRELLRERVGDDVIKWRKPIRFEVNGKPVDGWIGLLAKGKAAEAGFHLFRRDRLITGGPSQGWKPWEIFGAPNSFQSQRLIGEIDFDDWRISHTKDRIDWSGADEQSLIEALRQLSLDYIAKARESRRGESSVLSKSAAESVVEQTREELEESDELGSEIAIVEEGHLPEVDLAETEMVQSLLEELGESIALRFGGKAFPTLHLALSDLAHSSEPLVRMGFPLDDEIVIVLNLQHPFFEQFVGNSEQALKVLAHLLYIDALVERAARRADGLAPSQMRILKDGLLRRLRPLDNA